jgi:hypothetical protein
MLKQFWKCAGLVVALGLETACGGSSNQGEMSQSVGDTMASFDETGQGAGFAHLDRPVLNNGGRAFLKKSAISEAMSWLMPQAYAAGCWSERFSTCSGGQRTRTFNGCTLGPDTLAGTATLNFTDSSCAMSASGDAVTRTADLTLTGPGGGTLQVTSPSGGQRVTATATGWAYNVLGMERVATSPSGTKLFDISTQTTSDIGVTGTSRANRVMNGGTLQVMHNLLKYTVNLTPNNVTWNGTCNCAVSGSWTGSASGSINGDFNVELTGCGTANVTAPGYTASVSFDRCTTL